MPIRNRLTVIEHLHPRAELITTLISCSIRRMPQPKSVEHRAQDRDQLLALVLIKSRGGLIEQQVAGVGGERPGDTKQALARRRQ